MNLDAKYSKQNMNELNLSMDVKEYITTVWILYQDIRLAYHLH